LEELSRHIMAASHLERSQVSYTNGNETWSKLAYIVLYRRHILSQRISNSALRRVVRMGYISIESNL